MQLSPIYSAPRWYALACQYNDNADDKLYVFEKTRVACCKLDEENKSIKLQMFALKKLNYQRINELKMNESQRKIPQ